MKNDDPKISVLMPAYNTEKYISEAIESILNQTFEDFEFIILDDCSTDMTWEIIQRYAKKDERIVVLRNEENLGIPVNRNKLVSMAKGIYVVWQDSDDISLPYRIEKQFNFMEKNLDVGICGGWLQFFNNENLLGIRKYDNDDKKLRSHIFKYSPVAQPVAMIRRFIINDVGMYNVDYKVAQDLDMSFKIGIKYKFANIPEVLLNYREHDKSITFKKLKTQELNTIKIRNKYSHISAYKMKTGDKIYNFLQYLSIFIIPPKLKIKLFNMLRNKSS